MVKFSGKLKKKKIEMGQTEEGQSAKMQFYFPALCYFCAT